MTDREPEYKADWVISGIFLGTLVGFILGFAGCAAVEMEEIAGVGSGFDTYLTTQGICVALGIAWGAIADARDLQKRRADYERARAEAQRRVDDERRSAQNALERQIAQNARDASAWFASLPGWLRAVEQQRTQAMVHYRNGAFSPFWESIEAAYGFLGKYNDALERSEERRVGKECPV